MDEETKNQSVAADDWGPLSVLPGNPMMWLLIWSEMVVFGIGLIGYAVAFHQDPQVFLDSQSHLNRFLGGMNTMVLLTSGLCAALAVHFQSLSRGGTARAMLAGAICLGAVFLWIKALEYGEKIELGIDTETNNFYTLYFLLTGFHAVHVIFGMAVLAVVGWKNSVENVETGVAFWHMIDLVWVILFSVIYVMR